MRRHDQLLSPTVNNDSLSAKHLNDLEQTSRDLSKVISRFKIQVKDLMSSVVT